jgi:hypothetical protein
MPVKELVFFAGFGDGLRLCSLSSVSGRDGHAQIAYSDTTYMQKNQKETYNSGDSLVVTHPTTNPPI